MQKNEKQNETKQNNKKQNFDDNSLQHYVYELNQ